MKLLINICANDGISTHYTGVGTMIKRYISVIHSISKKYNLDFDLNLFTVESNQKTLGYDQKLENFNKKLLNTKLFKVSNGSNGRTSYGTLENWIKLSKNTAKIINNTDFSNYYKILTLIHDTPYCSLMENLDYNQKHIKVWIPHSTVKIHGASSDVAKSNYDLQNRFEFEMNSIKFINKTSNCYVGVIGKFITEHLIKEYNLNNQKYLNIYNGELMGKELDRNDSIENHKLFSKIKNNEAILLSFGRAEEYKNLESTMYLGKKINENIKMDKIYNNLPKITPVVIAQSYYKGQLILSDYKKTATITGTTLFIDPPWNFPHYILNNFEGLIIVLVPSRKEIMGLVINEIRKLNKNNILIVANDIDGLKEQIKTKEDGLLVNIKILDKSANQILMVIQDNKNIKAICDNGYKKLKRKYDFEKNFELFLKEVGINYE